MTEHSGPFKGRCACGHVHYEMACRPMIVHGCHCRYCQRESGASFATNALIEADRVKTTSGAVAEILVPSASGAGQLFARCTKCQTTLWSNYLGMSSGLGAVVRFVRVGTLENPDLFPPDVHIYTSTKQPWVRLPHDVPSFDEYFVIEDIWPPESMARRVELQKAVGTANR